MVMLLFVCGIVFLVVCVVVFVLEFVCFGGVCARCDVRVCVSVSGLP